MFRETGQRRRIRVPLRNPGGGSGVTRLDLMGRSLKFQSGADERIAEVAVIKYFGKLIRFAMIGYAVCDVNPVVATSGVNRMSQ